MQCWVQSQAGGAFHKCTTSKTILGTLSSPIVPCDVPNTALKNSLRKVPTTAVHQRHTQSQDRSSSKQGAATRCTVLYYIRCSLVTPHFTHSTGCQLVVPIRRAVHSSLKATKGQIPTWSSPRINVLNSMHMTHSMFQLVFQLCNSIPCRCTDSSHKSAMRRRHSQNCDETKMVDGTDAPNTLKRTGSQVPFKRSSLSVRLIPSLPHKDNPVAQPAQPTRAVTIPRADNWLRNQLTCLGLVPRVHAVAR